MKYEKSIILTTRVDRHGDRFTADALASMIDQINAAYIPVNIQHDPRIPPAGRVIGAEILELDDGESALQTLIEVFEPDDSMDLDPPGKRMFVRTYTDDKVHIIHDRSYGLPEDQELLEEIKSATAVQLEKEEKKALEPLSVLTIGGLFIAGGIASGFLAKVGADSWDLVKNKLNDLLRRKRAEGRERLLIFQCATPSRDGQVLFDIILTNPSNAEIEGFFTDGIKAVDHSVVDLLPFAEEKSIARMVFDFSAKGLSLQYAVRIDAVPLTIRVKPREVQHNDD